MAGIKGRLARLKSAAGIASRVSVTEDLVGGAAVPADGAVVQSGGASEALGGRAFLPGWQKLSDGLYERIRSTALRIDETEEVSFDYRPFFPRKRFSLSRTDPDIVGEGGLRALENVGRKKPDAGAARAEGMATTPVLDAGLSISFTEVSFFDLETTGLSGGAGTLAFLAAVGYFSDGALQIHQLFIDDFPAERDFLKRLVQLLSLRPNIVSFNGASFDLPLLKTRCVLNGLAIPDFFHIDALRLSRRLWKKSVGSCSLQSLEESVLGLSRQDDVPGFLIPRIWLDFIKSNRRTEESLLVMERVVEHNSLDVRSLARLLMIMDRLFYESGRRWREFRADPVAVARELAALGRKERAVELLYEVGEYGSEEALALLARFYRNSGDHEACGQVLDRLEGKSYYVCIEMAKCFEHVNKDPARALQLTQAAARIAEAEGRKLSVLGRERLEKRLNRLQKKLVSDQP